MALAMVFSLYRYVKELILSRIPLLRREKRTTMEDLPRDVMVTIFSFIPLKALIRLKLLSTTWRDFITNDFRLHHTPITGTGLVAAVSRVIHQKRAYRNIFLPPREDQELMSPITPPLPYFRPRLRGSCNGLPLFVGSGGMDFILDRRCLHFVRKVREPTRRAQMGLAYDGFGSDFKLVYFFYNEVDFEKGVMNCRIFSSETWKWRDVEARIHNIGLAMEEGFNRQMCIGTSMYLDGRLYWIWSHCMLQYDIGNETLDLFDLPLESRNIMRPFSKLLYESDGQIYFCFLRDDSLRIFAFVIRDNDCEWKPLRRTVTRQEWIDQDSPTMNWSGLWFLVQPCAFNQDLQQLILFVPPRRIVSYSLETGEFALMWTCEEIQGNDAQVVEVLPLLFKSSSRKWKARIP